MNFNEILNNDQNLYYGHGTGTTNDEVTQSIMQNGLRCSHGSLYFTSASLGRGSQIQKEEQEMLKKWPHHDSKIVVIVSLPMQYKIIDQVGTGTYNLGDAAYYYTPDETIREKYALTHSPYVMPEFIVGYYDARNDSFTANPRYYENLQEQERENLFNQVKENYFNIIDNGWGIEDYKDAAKAIEWPFELSEEEINRFKRKKEERELLSQIPQELLNKKLRLPSGETIEAKKYIQEIVLPCLPTSGYVYLNNGTKIPISHFIMECVIYDCQERYNGDFAKYMQENVELESTLIQQEQTGKTK